MSLYVADLHALRTQKIISSKFNLELNEPYTWFDYFIDEAVANNHKYILYHDEQEREISRMDSYDDYWEVFNDKLQKHDIKFIMAFSGYPKNPEYKFQEKYSNITIYNTPLYFLNFLYYLDVDIIKKLSYEIKNIRNRNNFKKLFINLNFKNHDFRCELMDFLCKNDLLKYGVYSWLKEGGNEDVYSFKYFDNEYRELGYKPRTMGRDYYWIDLLYENPLINLITESDDSKIGISEKTCKSILIGQPFIVYSAKGFHYALKEFGFELYDEIFDYSFDLYENRTDRIKAICDNLNKLKDKNLNEIYDLISYKLEKNKNIAIDIIENKKFIDQDYLKLMMNNKDKFENKISTFNFFNLDK